MFALFIIILVLLIIGAFIALYVDHERHKANLEEELWEDIKYTELLAKSPFEATFRVHYCDGTKEVININTNDEDYDIYFDKLR